MDSRGLVTSGTKQVIRLCSVLYTFPQERVLMKY